jgi:hypothetical protein
VWAAVGSRLMNPSVPNWLSTLNARTLIYQILLSVRPGYLVLLWLGTRLGLAARIRLVALFWFAWVLSFLQALPLSATELSTVYKLPAYIQQVTTLGEWQHNGKSGLLRMAITYRKGEYKMFLQWLSNGEVVSTVAVKEVNQGSRYIISDPKFTQSDNQKGVLYLNLFERQRENTYKAKIEVEGIGYYSCSFLPGGIVVGVD